MFVGTARGEAKNIVPPSAFLEAKGDPESTLEVSFGHLAAPWPGKRRSEEANSKKKGPGPAQERPKNAKKRFFSG